MMLRAVFKPSHGHRVSAGNFSQARCRKRLSRNQARKISRNKLRTRVAELISVPMQNNWNIGVRFNHNKTIYVLNVQSVLALWFEIVCCLSEATVYERGNLLSTNTSDEVPCLAQTDRNQWQQQPQLPVIFASGQAS